MEKDLELEKEIMKKYYEGLNNYLKLKKNYEEKLNKEKNKILNNKDLTLKEKRKKIKSIKGKCVKCNRKVNTIFKNDGLKYIALCGSSESPCELNILIKKPEIIDIEETYLDSLENIELYTEEIIKLKNNKLFNLDKEESIEEKIDELKKGYNEEKETSELYKNLLIELLENPEKKELLKKEKMLYYEKIKEINELMLMYEKENNENYLKEIVELYINEIKPLELKIRNNNYNYIKVEKDIYNKDEKYYLIKKGISNEQREVIIEEPTIRYNI